MHANFADVRGQLLVPVHHYGRPVVGIGWILLAEFSHGQNVTLINMNTGLGHVEPWERVKNWIERGTLLPMGRPATAEAQL